MRGSDLGINNDFAQSTGSNPAIPFYLATGSGPPPPRP
jgi:hypothetical protein